MPWTIGEKIGAATLACTIELAVLGGMYYLGNGVGQSACSNARLELSELKNYQKIDFVTFLQKLQYISKELSAQLQQHVTEQQYKKTIDNLRTETAALRSQIAQDADKIKEQNFSIEEIRTLLPKNYTKLQTFYLKQKQIQMLIPPDLDIVLDFFNDSGEAEFRTGEDPNIHSLDNGQVKIISLSNNTKCYLQYWGREGESAKFTFVCTK